MKESEDKVKLKTTTKKKDEGEKQDMLLATELYCGGFQLDGKVCWHALSNDIANPPLGGDNIFLHFLKSFSSISL